MDRKERFEVWSKKLGGEPGDFETEFQELLKFRKKSNPDIPEEKLDKLILREMQIKYKLQLRSTAEMFEGIVFGAGSIYDQFGRQRRPLQQKLKDLGKEKAIQEGIIDEEENFIFTEKYGFREAGDKMPPEKDSQQRRVIGMVRKKGSKDELKFFTMFLSHDPKREISDNSKATFRANVSSDSSTFTLNSSTATQFNFLDGEVNFRDAVKKYIPKNIVSLEKLFSKDGTVLKPDSPVENYIVTKGIVADISLAEDMNLPSHVIRIGSEEGEEDLDDTDVITCWVPKDKKIDFAIGSVVYFIGSAYSKEIDRDGKKSFDNRINVFGMWPDPAYNTFPENPPPEKSASPNEGEEKEEVF